METIGRKETKAVSQARPANPNKNQRTGKLASLFSVL